VEEPFEVGRHERPEVLGRVVGERLGEDPRVVDERVDRPEPPDGRLDDPGGGRRLADVAVDQGELPGLGERALLRDVARVRDDPAAPLQQRGDDAGPDALRGPGHDRRLRSPRHGVLPKSSIRV
jgi:hypothetical protein